jgi:type III pantothenate kinase
MLLALDVGNTNVTLGTFEGKRLSREWRVKTDPSMRAGALLAEFRKLRLPLAKIAGVAVASVVPPLDKALGQALRLLFGREPVWLTPRSRLGMKLRVKKPGEVGADRIANALAAAGIYGAPAVIVDFGTATTFDCIARNGDYLGGAILPGPNMAARALAEFTAKLPLVPVARPRRVVGKDTVECIQGGLYFGYIGMIEKVMALTLAEMGEPRARKLATGGLARLFQKDLRLVHAPDLTLHGVRIAYEKLA